MTAESRILSFLFAKTNIAKRRDHWHFFTFKIAMSLSTEAELMSNFGCLWTADARTKDEVALQWSCSPNITRNWDPPFEGLSG